MSRDFNIGNIGFTITGDILEYNTLKSDFDDKHCQIMRDFCKNFSEYSSLDDIVRNCSTMGYNLICDLYGYYGEEFINHGNYDFNKRNITKDDLMYFNEISELNIKKATDLTQASYIEIDIDNDGDLEYIYEGTYESNNNVKNGYSNEDFSTIFYLDNNKINVIELSKPFVEDKELYFDSYLIKEIIDLDNDGNLELIVEDYLFDYGTYNIYKIKDGKYKLFFTCDYE